MGEAVKIILISKYNFLTLLAFNLMVESAYFKPINTNTKNKPIFELSLF